MTQYRNQFVAYPELGEFAEKCAEITQLAYPAGAAWSVETFKRDMTTAKRAYLLRYDHDQLVGYIGIIQVLDQVDITGVAVHPDYQRRGHAQALFEALVAQLATGSAIFLEVRVSNTAAQSLYERVGFKVIGKRPAYYSNPDEDAILMKFIVNVKKGDDE